FRPKPEQDGSSRGVSGSPVGPALWTCAWLSADRRHKTTDQYATRDGLEGTEVTRRDGGASPARTSCHRRERGWCLRGLFLEHEAAANGDFFVAATDTAEHLLIRARWSGVRT